MVLELARVRGLDAEQVVNDVDFAWRRQHGAASAIRGR
jgi:hypothetical protein